MEWPERRGTHAATCVSGPLLVIMGGMINAKTMTSDCWIYDFTTMLWKKVLVSEICLLYLWLVLLAVHVVLIICNLKVEQHIIICVQLIICMNSVHNTELNPLTAEFLWRRFTHFHLTWVCWLAVLQDFTCCHQTYNYSRPWSAPPGELPFISRNHAHSGAPPPQSGLTTQFNGFTRFASTACSHKSTQPGCSCAWVLASAQAHKLVQSMPMQKPYKHCDGARGCAPSNPAMRGDTPSCTPPPCVHFSAGSTPKKCGFFSPKSALCIWWIFTHLDLFLREVFFFK